MRFRLVPKSTTLDDLEGQCALRFKTHAFFGAHHKNFNEDRPTLSAERCSALCAQNTCSSSCFRTQSHFTTYFSHFSCSSFFCKFFDLLSVNFLFCFVRHRRLSWDIRQFPAHVYLQLLHVCSCRLIQATRPIEQRKNTSIHKHIAITHSKHAEENKQESPAVADKPARRLRKVCTVYV